MVYLLLGFRADFTLEPASLNKLSRIIFAELIIQKIIYTLEVNYVSQRIILGRELA
jgi:hypothetical protein